MTLKALIFDVDGTLADTEELHRKAFNTTFAEYGLDWHWDEQVYDRLLRVTGGQRRIIHFIEHEQPQRAGDFIDETATMHKRKTAIYGQMLKDGLVELRPGVEDLIRRAIDKGLKLGISTSTSRINVDVLFAATMGTDVLDNFTAICCGNEVSENKPSPELYLLALKRLNLAPDECLAIEDSQLGLQSATGAKIPTIITVSKYCKNDDFTGAEQVMDNLVAGKFALPA